MASKKGIALTITILAAITGASFLLWMIPQENETTFVMYLITKNILTE